MSSLTRKIKAVQSNSELRRWEEILKRIPENRKVIGAEIGIWKGYNAREIIKARPLITHIMVDPWDAENRDKSFIESGSQDSQVSQAEYDKCFNVTLIRIGPWLERCKIMRMKSIDAAKQMQDNSLDYVFIDGDHSYKGVKRDIEAWYPKVKLGGWIGGHDYHIRFKTGVMKAVDEAFPSEVEFGGDMTWFIRK